MKQYIGARYVIKIYENSNDPSTADWQENVNYEPLTMVTYNYGSYLSKKTVPANIGNPASNGAYWVQTGFYNGQIADLYNHIQNIESKIANLDTLENYTEDVTLSENSFSLNKKEIEACAHIKVNDADIKGYVISSSHNPVIELGNNVRFEDNELEAPVIGVHLNSNGSKTKVIDNDITANDFGVLINEANNGHGIIVTNNTIEASVGDAVEINTPNNEDTQDTSGIIVNSNYLKSEEAYQGVRGFGVGIARGRDVVVCGNVCEVSALAGIHVEDNTKKVIISNNVFDNCETDGASISVNYSKNNFEVNGLTNGGRPILVNNNIFNGKSGNTDVGLSIVNTANDDDAIVCMQNNIISGFGRGIQSASSSNKPHARDFNGCVVTDCAIGMGIGNTYNIGEVTFSDITNEIINADGLCHIDGIHILDVKDPDDIIVLHPTNPTALTINKITANLSQSMSDGNNYNLFKIPAVMSGIFTVDFYVGGTRFSRTIETDGETLTVLGGISYGPVVFTLAITNGYITVSTYNLSTAGNVIVKFSFDGALMYKNE